MKKITMSKEDVFSWIRMKMAQDPTDKVRGLDEEAYMSDRITGRFWLLQYLSDKEFEKLYKRCMSELAKAAKERGMEFVLWH